jgi:hypothetical protein
MSIGAQDAMLSRPTLSKVSRNWQLVVIASVAGLAAGLAVFPLCGPHWLVVALTETSDPVAAAVMAVPFGLGAAAVAGLFVNARRRAQTRLIRAQ